MVNKYTFYEMALTWIQNKETYVKITTSNAYHLIIHNHLNPEFGEQEEITESDLQKFILMKLGTGLSQKTVKDIIVVFNMIMRYAFKQGMHERVLYEVLYPVNQKKSSLSVLPKESMKKVFYYIENNFTFNNLGIFICLSTGIRIGEVCALKWSDVNLENGTLSIQRTIQRTYNKNDTIKTKIIIDTPKTINSNREVPLSNKLIKLLKSLKKIVNNDYYIISNHINPIEPRTYRIYFIKLLDELEIQHIKFHALRHTFATRCIESGADYKTISVILGHSNISTTLNLYVHPNHEQKKKCIEKMLKSI